LLNQFNNDNNDAIDRYDRFTGDFDDVRLFSHALSADERLRVYNGYAYDYMVPSDGLDHGSLLLGNPTDLMKSFADGKLFFFFFWRACNY
jgi:hypothetical protein